VSRRPSKLVPAIMFKRLPLGVLLAILSLSVAAADAPGPPQNLSANVSGNTVTLTWQAPTTGGVPTSYVVEASLSPGGPPLASLPVPGTTLSVPNVPNGVYYVRVRGVNGDGTSEASNEVIVVVPGGGGGCSSPPNPPQNLTGSATGNIVTITWSPPVGGCAATSYAVQAGSAPGQSNITVVNVGPARSLSASAPAGTYYLRVVALNTFGGSTASNEIAVTVAAPCQRPGAPFVLTPTVSGSTVTFSWIAPGGTVAGYWVEAGSAPGSANLLNTTTGATTYTWTNAPTGTHYIRVRAFNACGTGPASNEVMASVTSAPPPPPPPPPSDCGPRTVSCGQATARCNDGTYSCSQNRPGTCSSHGGVACWICPGKLCSGDESSNAFGPFRAITELHRVLSCT
jgi:predicted phage tail protein